MNSFRGQRLGVVALAMLILAPVAGVSSAGSLHSYPSEIRLSSSQDRQRVIVQEELPDGVTRDVTAEGVFEIANPEIASFHGNIVSPLSDGNTELTIRVGGEQLVIPVQVRGGTNQAPISFRRDVQPVLTKAGCNSGSCHGAASGQDGFSLSLFGFDPARDYQTITRQWVGRRIQSAIPAESLLLKKATAAVPHTGGSRITRESEDYQTLLRWLTKGALDDEGATATVVALEIFPPQAVLQGAGAKQEILVRALYSDDTDRDVTDLCSFESTNEQTVRLQDASVLEAGGRGESFITARFDTQTVGFPVIVLPEGVDLVEKLPVANNYIDQAVHNKLRRLRIHPSAICDDSTFIRRATLDLCGRLPSVEECQSFLDDRSEDKRAGLIDALMEREEFVDVWTMKWADVLQLRTGGKLGKKAVNGYYRWIREQIASGEPLDKMAHALLAASGGTFSNAAANYYQTEADFKKISENVAQVFLGMRLQCSACHNHPFDRWTMDDYYGFAAFFAQVGKKAGEDYRETIVFNKASGEMRHPVGERVMQPKFLGGESPEVGDRDRREVLAEWIASADNPYFARHMANTIWAHFFHRGIVDDPDDVRVSNPPVNQELLTAIASRLKQYRFDPRRLIRDICNSRTYQLSIEPNATNLADEENFARAHLRRLGASVLLDTISQVTDTTDSFEQTPAGTRAVQLPDGAVTTPFLFTFGRSARETVCSCEVRMEPNLSQALHLLNGDTVHEKISEGGLVDLWMREKMPADEVLDEVYVRCLSRRPSESEKKELMQLLAQYETQREGLVDIFWSLLNSSEFLFNH
jgi:hypothetical protein